MGQAPCVHRRWLVLYTKTLNGDDLPVAAEKKTSRGSSIVFVVRPLLTMSAGMAITLAESSCDSYPYNGSIYFSNDNM